MICTLPDLESVCREAAALFVRQAQLSVTHRERFAVALSGGHTPRCLYEILWPVRPFVMKSPRRKHTFFMQ